MSYEEQFLLSLFLTLIVEVPIVFIFLKYVYKKYRNIENSTIFFVGILASSLTLPYLWFVLPAFIVDRNTLIILGEFVIILAEAFFYYKLLKLKLLDAFVVSLVANMASIIFGLLVK